MDEERTEQPTPHSRQRARERGQVAKSRELTGTFVLLVGFLTIFLIMGLWGKLSAGVMYDMLGGLGNIAVNSDNMQSINGWVLRVLFEYLWPLLLATAATAVLVNLLQTRGVISLEPIRPKLENLDPMRGVRRMFSARGFVELLKAVLKIVLVVLVAYGYIRANLPAILQAQTLDPSAYVPFFGGHAFRLGLWIIAVLLLLSILDYIYQLYQHEKDLMLTKQEAKEEYKRMEGDPLVRSRIRARQRQIAMTRMLREVPRADVVVTNPTRVAVALRYESDMPSPQVVAKGKGAIAERIIALAKEFGVHIHRDPPLARALYSMVEIGGMIPYDFYVALAEILAYVYRSKRRYAKQRRTLMAG
jgi:flagellar biosynthetic protein FlhB